MGLKEYETLNVNLKGQNKMPRHRVQPHVRGILLSFGPAPLTHCSHKLQDTFIHPLQLFICNTIRR